MNRRAVAALIISALVIAASSVASNRVSAAVRPVSLKGAGDSFIAGFPAAPLASGGSPAGPWRTIGPQNISLGTGFHGGVGLYGAGKTSAFAMDPSNPQVMYSGGGAGQGASGPFAESGAFKSVDGGASWSPIDQGLTDPLVDVISVDPANSSVIIAGTWYAGIFRSVDGGGSWSQVWTSPAQTSAAVTALVRYNGTLYAATSAGVEASVDAGATWTSFLPTGFGVDALDVKGGTFLVGLANGDVYVRGSTPYWQHVFSDPGWAVTDVAVNLNDPQNGFVVEWNNYQDGNLFVTHDGGNGWSQYSTHAMGVGAVQFVAFDPVNSSYIYVGVDGQLYRSTDTEVGTSTGSSISFIEQNGTYPFSVGGIAGLTPTLSSGSVTVSGADVAVNVSFSSSSLAAAVGAGVVHAGGPSQLAVCTPPQIYLLLPSISGGNVSLNGVTTPGGGCTISSITWYWGDGSNSTSLFPATHLYRMSGDYTVIAVANQSDGQQGSATEAVTVSLPVHLVTFTETGLPNGTSWSVFLRSGATWTPLPLNVDILMILPANGRVYVASDQGMYASGDGGLTWGSLNGDLSTSLLTGFALQGGRIFTAVQDYSPVVSFDGGSTWSVGQGPQAATGEDGMVAVNPGNSSYVYLYTNAGLQLSTDGGHNFASVGVPFGFTGAVQQIAFDPSNPAHVLVAAPPGVEYSLDFGRTFANTSWPFQNPSLVAFSPSDNRTIFVGDSSGLHYTNDGGSTWSLAAGTSYYGPPMALAVNPSDPSKVLVGFFSFGGGVRRSIDGGKGFSPSSTGLSEGALTLLPSGLSVPYVYSVAFSPANASVVALATTNGVYLSIDGGISWLSAQGNLITPWISGVQWNGSTLYVSTYGRGVEWAALSSLLPTPIPEFPSSLVFLTTMAGAMVALFVERKLGHDRNPV